MEKNALRQMVLERRDSLSKEVRKAKSRIILKALEGLKGFKKAHHVLFYYAVKSEVETLPLLSQCLSEKKCYLPVIQNETNFEAFRVESLEDLAKGLQGVPEPPPKEKAQALDLILVPGVAFDKAGNRLGTGKGYYDRFLARYPGILKVGLAYAEQMVEKLPQDPYDVPVDFVITD